MFLIFVENKTIMKNIHLLPTDKPSRIIKSQDNDFVVLNTDAPNWFGDYLKTTKQHIYITSDDKFVKDEYITDGIEVIKASPKLVDAQGLVNRRDWKKIILTTDQDLIKDGVQSIDDEFLEWFVKNPSCEFVEIVVENYTEDEWIDDDFGGETYTFEYEKYKIIIPKEEPTFENSIDNTMNIMSIANSMFGKKEEPKQETIVRFPPYYENKQETLEEAASRVLYNKYPYHPPQDSGYWKDMFKEGYKFAQQQMYSEKEVPNKLDSVLAKITHQNDLGLSQWYEVVYYDVDNGKWCSYSGSKTFEDGERVVGWKYCKEIF
jgi:hypothetical protein